MYCNVPGCKCSKEAPLRNSGHNMIYMTSKYKRKLKANRPTEKTITSQPENIFDMLNTCFDLTNWNVFTQNSENIEEITEIVNGYIKFNEERPLEKKVIKVFRINKPWITSNLRKKIMEKHSSFSQNSPNYSEKQKEVEYSIHEAKKVYNKKVEQHFYSNNMRDAWKGRKILTG